MLNKIKNTVSFIRNNVSFTPEVGIILGSGLGALADHMEVIATLPYCEIPNFPISTVVGHRGALVFGILGGKRTVVMQGRFHYYEGYTTQEVVFPVRVMHALGIKTLLVSNASGGVNPTFTVDDLMVITDHINLLPNPLIGPNDEKLGPRFPNMSGAYDADLVAIALDIARQQKIVLHQGCYLGTTGPTLETPAEYHFYQTIGADAIGMSTTPEVIAARHLGLRVFGLSVITNVARQEKSATHEQVVAEGARAADKMEHLVTELLRRI